MVPMLAATVPTLVLYDSANAKDMALNTLSALFLLQVDNEAFSFALPDGIRKHVEEYGRMGAPTSVTARRAFMGNSNRNGMGNGPAGRGQSDQNWRFTWYAVGDRRGPLLVCVHVHLQAGKRGLIKFRSTVWPWLLWSRSGGW